MQESWTYQRALEELWDRSSYERGTITDPFGDDDRAERGLVRVRQLLQELGDPHQRLPLVHVAGSKGKGSTCAFIAAAGMAAGLRVGFYSSPHLHRFPERIAIDGAALSDAAFASVAQSVSEASSRLEARSPDLGAVTTFEFVTAMGFVAFAEANCDLAVIEVGLGGRYDATNVITPLVSVITRIDFEHTAVLGNTLAEIAEQKAGILQPGVPVVVAPQEASARLAIAQVADAIGSPLLLGGHDWDWEGNWQAFTASGPWGRWADLSTGIIGPHQVVNACTATMALYLLGQRGLEIPETAIRAGLATAHWPGRFERVLADDRLVVFDAAHTPASAAALTETWLLEVGEQPATAIIGMGTDKHPASFLAALRPAVQRVIATRADSPRAMDPTLIAAAAAELGIPVETLPTVSAALARALECDDAPVLITGSLFVAGEAREALGLAEPDHAWRRLNETRAVRTSAP